MFDSLDFVFMDGDANILPWAKGAENVRACMDKLLVRKIVCTVQENG